MTYRRKSIVYLHGERYIAEETKGGKTKLSTAVRWDNRPSIEDEKKKKRKKKKKTKKQKALYAKQRGIEEWQKVKERKKIAATTKRWEERMKVKGKL
jgi:hypothetical protein